MSKKVKFIVEAEVRNTKNPEPEDVTLTKVEMEGDYATLTAALTCAIFARKQSTSKEQSYKDIVLLMRTLSSVFVSVTGSIMTRAGVKHQEINELQEQFRSIVELNTEALAPQLGIDPQKANELLNRNSDDTGRTQQFDETDFT